VSHHDLFSTFHFTIEARSSLFSFRLGIPISARESSLLFLKVMSFFDVLADPALRRGYAANSCLCLYYSGVVARFPPPFSTLPFFFSTPPPVCPSTPDPFSPFILRTLGEQCDSLVLDPPPVRIDCLNGFIFLDLSLPGSFVKLLPSPSPNALTSYCLSFGTPFSLFAVFEGISRAPPRFGKSLCIWWPDSYLTVVRGRGQVPAT